MTLSSGSAFGPYEVVGLIGAGGMGEVYRAHDTRLGRDVALKILSEAFTSDPDRLARFEREARVLASLNHPNIAQIYGIEDSEGVRALVMELVGGEELSEILARGAVPLTEALPIARQIAEALETAHEAGIVHRDLKPANVKVRPDGVVKVLDFGIAKAADPDSGVSSAPGRPEDSPTLLSPAITQIGSILGTAAYMSPEQARGKTVDRRTDIWAFGVVLFEMLAGERLFTGETASDVVASVLRKAIDLSALPAETPDAIRYLLGRCLERDMKRRLQAIGEARLTLEEAGAGMSARVSDIVGPRPGMATGSNRAASSGATPIALEDHRTETRGTSRGRPYRSAMLAGVVLTIAVFSSVAGMRYCERTTSAVKALDSSAGRSLAVLPFVNSSGNPDDEYLADGMTDELIASLGKVRNLRVAARSSAFAFKGRKAEAREVAEKLGVDAILEGTLRRSGKRLRVTASLVNASDGMQIWSSTFENDGGDSFAVQDEVTQGVVGGLSLQLGGTALQASQAGRTEDPEAHDLYLRGLASANPASEADLLRAIEFYQQAIAKDPEFALPYAGIAWAHIFLADAYVAPGEAGSKAKAAALAAIERDSLLSDPHALLAYATFVTEWTRPSADLSTVEQEFRTARELDPNSVNTLTILAIIRCAQGRTDEALGELDQAERLDPLSPVAPFVRVWCDSADQRYDAVIGAHRRMQSLDPSFVYIESWVGNAYREMGDYASALREYEAADRLLGGAPQPGLALTYARMGREQEARELMKKLDEHAARRYIPPSMRAMVHSALGDTEGGISLLQEAFDKKDLYLVVGRPVPEMARLLEDPRVRPIVERLNAIRNVK